MATIRRDLPGGGYVLVDEDTGNVVQTVGANGQQGNGQGGSNLPIQTAPEPESAPPQQSMAFPYGIGQTLADLFGNRGVGGRGRPDPTPAPAVGQSAGFGQSPDPNSSPVGVAAGQPPMEFGEPQLAPEDQAAIETLTNTQQQLAQGVQLPPFPTLEADPALASRVTRAETRRDRLDPVIERMLAQVEGQLGARDAMSPMQRNMQDFGRWLGLVGASGTGRSATPTLIEMREGRAEREQNMMERVLRLTEAGYGLDEAVMIAQENVQSGEHQARQGTALGGYERGVSQAGVNVDSQRAAANLGLGIAQLQQEAGANARTAQEAAIAAVGEDPRYTGEASREISDRAFPGSPQAAGAFGESLRRRARLSRLAAQVGTGMNRGDERQLLRQLQRIDPTVTAEEAREIAIMMQGAPAR